MVMQYNREQLVGNWFGVSQEQSGEHCSETAIFGLDGSFEFTFVSQDSHGTIIELATQYGDWGLVADIHFTITKSELIEQDIYGADLGDHDNYHAYRVLLLTPKVFQYQDVLSKEVFMLLRVADTIGHC